jgi:hypothetical protein
MARPPRTDYYAEGDWNAMCSMCGRKRKASELVKNWKGQYRCPEHNEPREAQDFVKGIVEHPTPPWVQPIPADAYVGVCTPNGQTAYAGSAVAGCAAASYISPMFDPNVTA